MPFAVAAGVGAAATVAGAAIQADSARSAGNKQADAARNASAVSQAQYETNRRDQYPWTNAGGDAISRMSQLLGLPTNSTPLTQESLVDTSGSVPGYNPRLYRESPAYKQAWDQATMQHQAQFNSPYTSASNSANINATVQGLLGDKLTQEQAARDQQSQSPESQSSLGQFFKSTAGNQEFDSLRQSNPDLFKNLAPNFKSILSENPQLLQNISDKNVDGFGKLSRSFTADDLKNDVVYNSGLQFGLDQGTQGIERRAAGMGALDSGATLKALTRFGNDYGSTKAGDAYTRFMGNRQSLYDMANTDATNQYGRLTTDQNTQYNMANNDRSSMYNMITGDQTNRFNRQTADDTNLWNRMAGVAGVGQQAVNQVGNQGMTNANNIGENTIGAGNARGASTIAAGNAWGGAGSTLANMYQQNSMWNQLMNKNNDPYGGGAPGTPYMGTSNARWL